jgi:hypothetical protein
MWSLFDVVRADRDPGGRNDLGGRVRSIPERAVALRVDDQRRQEVLQHDPPCEFVGAGEFDQGEQDRVVPAFAVAAALCGLPDSFEVVELRHDVGQRVVGIPQTPLAGGAQGPSGGPQVRPFGVEALQEVQPAGRMVGRTVRRDPRCAGHGRHRDRTPSPVVSPPPSPPRAFFGTSRLTDPSQPLPAPHSTRSPTVFAAPVPSSDERSAPWIPLVIATRVG